MSGGSLGVRAGVSRLASGDAYASNVPAPDTVSPPHRWDLPQDDHEAYLSASKENRRQSLAIPNGHDGPAADPTEIGRRGSSGRPRSPGDVLDPRLERPGRFTRAAGLR